MATRRRILLTVLALVDLAMVAVAFLLSYAGTMRIDAGYGSLLDLEIPLRHVVVFAGYLALWHLVLRANGLYRSYRLSSSAGELRNVGQATLVAVAALLPLDALAGFEEVSPKFLVTFAGVAFLGLFFERRFVRLIGSVLRGMGINLREIVVVGEPAAARRTAQTLASRDALGYRVLDVIEVDPTTPDHLVLERLEETVNRRPIDEVFLALPTNSSLDLFHGLIATCEEQGITVRVVANLAVFEWAWTAIDVLVDQPIVTIATGSPEIPRFQLAKRAIDLVVSLCAVLALIPIGLLIAIAIKLDSKGPVFFAQERVGFNRRRFKLFKFRTMVPDAEARQAALEERNEASGPVFKIRNDPRITRVGAFLRRTSLDELPQFLNVLIGDMSLVGPRPLPLRDVERLDVRWHKRRFSVKPGITCLWQIGKRTPEFDDWIRSDMEYIDNWSLGLDLKILFKTIPAVLTSEAAC
ncbi:MAG: sugar transferase [Candidatus Binatia bacterium]